MAPSRRGLLRNPDFTKLWTGQTVSVFGTSITALAVPLIAASVLAVSPFEFGLLTTIQFVPFMLLSLPAGVWVDRLRRRPLMIWADLGRAVAIGSIPVAFAFDALTIWQLYLVTFVTGCLSVFYGVAYQSYLPSIVDRDQLVEGNAKLEISRSASQILGPGAAGLMIGILRAPFAMTLDALSYLWSAACVILIRRPEPPIPTHDEAIHGPRPSMRAEIVAGLRYVTDHPWLRSIAATAAVTNLFGTMVQAILILYLVRERNVATEAIGFAFSIGSLGVLLAALTTSAITRRVGVGPMLVAMSLGFSVSSLPIAVAPDGLIFPALVVSGFVGGFAGVGWNINQISLRQAITPPRMQGRMNATIRFIVLGTVPVGSILGGALGGLIGLHPTIWVGAIGCLASFLPVTLSSVRGLQAMPEPFDDAAPGAPGAAAEDGEPAAEPSPA